MQPCWSSHGPSKSGTPPSAIPPFCLVPALRGQRPAKMAQPKPGSVKMLTATFRFPESTVQALLSGIHPHCPEATPFVALASLCWWRAATNRPNKVVANEHNLTVSIDFRKLMHAPPPHGFYGNNAIHFSKVSVDKTHVEGGRLGQLAAAIQSHLSQVGTRRGVLWSGTRNGCKRRVSICLQRRLYGRPATTTH